MVCRPVIQAKTPCIDKSEQKLTEASVCKFWRACQPETELKGIVPR